MKAFTELTEREIQTICRTIIYDMMDIEIRHRDIEIVDVDAFHIIWKLKTVYFTYSAISGSVSVTSADGDEEIDIFNSYTID